MNEIVRDLTKEEARHLTDEVKGDYEKLKDKILRLYKGRAWIGLKYNNWHEYYNKEFGGLNFALERDERKEIVVELYNNDMPKTHIATALGVDEATIRRDLATPSHSGSAFADQQLHTVIEPPNTVTYSDQPVAIDHHQLPETNEVEVIDEWSSEERKMQRKVLGGEIVVVSLRGSHKNLIEWAQQQGIYTRVDRRSEWGNPFEMPADGNRETVIENYMEHYLPYKPSLEAKKDDLKGNVLGCWCAPLPCHADVIKVWVEN